MRQDFRTADLRLRFRFQPGFDCQDPLLKRGQVSEAFSLHWPIGPRHFEHEFPRRIVEARFDLTESFPRAKNHTIVNQRSEGPICGLNRRTTM